MTRQKSRVGWIRIPGDKLKIRTTGAQQSQARSGYQGKPKVGDKLEVRYYKSDARIQAGSQCQEIKPGIKQLGSKCC